MTRARETRVGPYLVEVKLGDGGMGVVYKAHDPRLHRSVAVKVLRERLAANERYLARLSREARLLASVSHPAVIQIYAFEEAPADGRALPYLVMEFVDGESLEARLDEGGPLDLPEAIGAARQAAEGLRAALEKGIIHRDIKPSNLLVTRDGVLKIVDFGLAKEIDAGGTLTDHGIILGTPQYISPEQATGAGSDHRSDIYSLGATLYHLLTGKTVFDGDSQASMLYAHVHEAPVPPHRVRQDLPETVSQVIGRMLSKSPSDRYADYRDLIRDLERLERGEAPLDATRESARSTYRPRGPQRRSSLLAWIASAVAMAALASLGAVLLATRPEGDRESLVRESLGDLLHVQASGRESLRIPFREFFHNAVASSRLPGVFVLENASGQPLEVWPRVDEAGLRLDRGFRRPLAYRHEVRGLRTVILEGLQLENHAALGVSITNRGPARVRELEFVALADRPSRSPIRARRHGVAMDLDGPPPEMPALRHGQYDLRIALEPLPDDRTRVTLRVQRGRIAGAFYEASCLLEGSSWDRGALILRPSSYDSDFRITIGTLVLTAEDVVGPELARDPTAVEI